MEPGTDVIGPAVGGPNWTAANSGDQCRNTHRVRDVMSQDVVTAAPEDTVFSVAQQMSERRVSCVVVTRQERVIGILTEKDMLDTVARGGSDLYQLRVSERMSSPVDTIPADASLVEADRMMESLCIRRLPVLEGERLAGIVTQTDLTRALISLNSLGCVSDIMTKHVTTVGMDATVWEAARLMSISSISCLIVTQGEKIAGILTEKDLLKRIIALQKTPAQTQVMDVMSLPVVTVPPGCSILDASKKMETMHFHRLLVTEGMAICGLVTQTDIMRAVRRSSEAMEARQCALTSELADLLQRAIRDIQRTRDFLSGIPHPPANTGPSANIAAPPLEEMVLCATPVSKGSC